MIRLLLSTTTRLFVADFANSSKPRMTSRSSRRRDRWMKRSRSTSPTSTWRSRRASPRRQRRRPLSPVRAVRPELGCLMLTSFADSDALNASYLAGARGYVLKNVRGDETDHVDPQSGQRRDAADARTDRPRERATTTTDQRGHPPREPQPSRAPDTGPAQRGLSNREIADVMFLAEKTIKNYVSNLLAKLGFQRRTEAALFAQRQQDRAHRRTRRR